MTIEERKRLAERLRAWNLTEDILRAAADLIDPPQPAATERLVVQVFRAGNVLFADGFSNDTDESRDRRVLGNRGFGNPLAATIVADVPLPPEPPVVEGRVQP